ncbi:MAG: NYN domain-containing protein [Promethearchaeota archaeon]|jgi:hypothetical protein
MDTGEDFITPQFLNILFFQQKNLAIFPYVDLKHLHALEIFAPGYTPIDLESTALHDLKNILEFESTNSYSQSPTLYFIYNLTKEKVKEILTVKDVHCVLNANENISEYVNGSNYIFFNKKNNQFLNFPEAGINLDFENFLISSSQNSTILQDTIQKIKSIASRIFTEVNQSNTFSNLPKLLQEFDKKHWQRILDFTSNYYGINVPTEEELKKIPVGLSDTTDKHSKNFSDEYDTLISTNNALGKEFVLLLHKYRSEKVNPSHLELEELFNPKLLYNYLRNHHWKQGIPQDYIKEWILMNISGYPLTDSDSEDFQTILRKLSIQGDIHTISTSIPEISKIPSSGETISEAHSTQTEWEGVTLELQNNLDEVERLLEQYQNSFILEESTFSQFLLTHLSELELLLNSKNKDKIINNQKSDKVERIIVPSGEQNHKAMLVDITNILNMDKDLDGKLRVENVMKVYEAVSILGYTPQLIADASMRYAMDNRDQYDKLVDAKIVLQSPAETKADEYILEIAREEQCYFLTNDRFQEYQKEFGKDWIYFHRFTCFYFNGKFIIRNKH